MLLCPQLPNSLKIFGRIDSRGGGRFGMMDRDAMAVPEPAQLFELLGLLDWADRPADKFTKRICTKRIDSDVPIGDGLAITGTGQMDLRERGPEIALIRNWSARKVQRKSRSIADYFYNVRALQMLGIQHRCGSGGHSRSGVQCQCSGDLTNQRRCNQGLIALNIDDALRWRGVETLCHLSDAIGAALMIGPCEDCFNATRGAGIMDLLIIGGDNHTACAAGLRALCHTDHHGPAADIGQRLIRQTRRSTPCRNDGPEVH